MAVLCRLCNRSNPSEAVYCYHDGSVLSGAGRHGAQDPAQAPFPVPFSFPSGAVCQNFDQLALTCHSHWQETGELLRNGVLPRFLAQVGRMDLQQAAVQAAAETDRDYGIDWFIARLPSRNLAEPRLHVAPSRHDLGALRPGHDYHFDLQLRNDGHRLIVGSVTSDCAWLESEGAATSQPRVLQFADTQPLRIRVLGSKLAAAKRPREGKLLIVTNGGSAEVPVTCTVPIIPFPAGVLKGCQSPREVAMKAKAHPMEAGDLFFRGKVQEWYQSNGWPYPVQGAAASGTAAVQQFFEALGVTKAPHVVLDTHGLGFQGTPGARLEQQLHLHTADNRPIYAFAQPCRPWLTIVNQATQGGRASITVAVQVPVTSEPLLRTHVDIQANGNQRFRVPVALDIQPVEATVAAPALMPTPMPDGTAEPVAQRQGGRACCLLTAVVAAGLLMVAGGAALLVAFLWQRPELWAHSPVEPYKAAVGAKTCVVAEVNLRALEECAEFTDAAKGLRGQLAQYLRDLDLQPNVAGRGRPDRLFVAVTAGERPLVVLTFAEAVQLGKASAGHYEMSKTPLCVDQLDRGMAWAVDRQGRLVGGPERAVRAALERDQKGTRSHAYDALVKASLKVAPEAFAWGAGDFTGGGTEVLASFLGANASKVHLQRFMLEIAPQPLGACAVRGAGVFPSAADAKAGGQAILALPRQAVPLLPADVDFSKQDMRVEEGDLRTEVNVPSRLPAAILQTAGTALEDLNRQTALALDDLARKECEAGTAASKRRDFEEAVAVFERVVARFPRNDDAPKLLNSGRKTLGEKQAYDAGIKAGRDALESGDVTAARTALDRIKKSPFLDDRHAALAKEIAAQQGLAEFRDLLKNARAQLSSDHLEKACAFYQRACKLRPADGAAKSECEAVQLLLGAHRAVEESALRVAERRLDAAHRELLAGLNKLLSARSSVWQEEPLKGQRRRLLDRGAADCRTIYDALKSAAVQARKDALALVAKGRYIDADEGHKRAQQRLAQAKATLADFQRLDAAGIDVTAERRILDATTEQLRKESVEIASKRLLAEGTQALDKAKAAIGEVRSDPEAVAPALALLDVALKALRGADELSAGIATEPARTAEKLRQRLGYLRHPVALDLAKGLAKSDWVFRKQQWEVRRRANGERWLQSNAVEPVALQSVRRDWPVEFELAIDFALVDSRGDIGNQHWAYHADPLTIRLLSRTGNDTVIALGHDASYKLDQVARLNVNGRGTIADGFLPAGQPIHLVLRCTRANADAKPNMSVEINERRVCSVGVAGDIDGVHLRAANPAKARIPRFVAIFGLDVRWAKDKAKAPPSPAMP